MEINYRKNNNKQLFEVISKVDYADLEAIQNYIPLYAQYFELNSSNYNSINLNNKYKLETFLEKESYNKFLGTIIDSCNNKHDTKIYVKFSPLVDPIKYMLGKYDTSYNILELPKHLEETNEMYSAKYKKILDPNNSAYIDGFFSFLSSYLLNNHNFYNGINYYGGFLGIKNKYKLDVSEDIEFLAESDYFHNHKNSLFFLEDSDKVRYFFNNTRNNKKTLVLNINDSLIVDDLELDLCVINNDEKITSSVSTSSDIININDEVSALNETDPTNCSLTYENISTIEKQSHKSSNSINESNKSGLTCSSRSSNTCSTSPSDDDDDAVSSNASNSAISSASSTCDAIYCTIEKFPVKMIILECCEDTLDSYILSKKISDAEWESIVLQILFTLITYQKIFHFTHNDLHTNNIVYIFTEKKYLYYKYNNSHYKVPTFGKIYKIIDFGRAIYKFRNKFICSDSYSDDGDASTQYNCEPYFNDNKPRIDPNYSFDLCRLGCSLFDYFIEDLENIKKIKSSIKKIIIEWVYDDKNKNILYKNDGSERYPDFKLYKMIARIVHKHTPQNVLKNPLFEKYQIAKKKINNPEAIFNIDILEPMI
uniref:Protein kinase domain-containing protein n=1 Tax=viral metagenome TaxID=1070528 RepID=A0A6C0DVV5_9ZZZZ